MLTDKMEKALNEQINAELYSAYLYLSMASYFQSRNLAGFTNWMKIQAMEETYHAMKIYGFLEDRGGRPAMGAIKQPDTDWDSPLAAFEAVSKHEQLVTRLINNLVDVAREEKDHATESFLQWFVNEQVEEEASADDIVQQLKLAGDQGAGLFMIDRELKARAFNLAPDVKVAINQAGGA